MPRIKVLPHAQICPEGAEFEVEQNANLCESLLKNGIKIEHACDMSAACTTCHVVVRKGFDSLEEMNDVEKEAFAKALGNLIVAITCEYFDEHTINRSDWRGITSMVGKEIVLQMTQMWL